MAIRELKNDDWTFGNGRNNYILGQNEIAQNITTRIRSFKNDFFLSADENIDWITILSTKNNRKTILDNIRRVVLQTPDVLSISRLEITQNDTQIIDREIIVLLTYNDIHSQNTINISI